ncbi:DUF4132 domain-containing protein [Insolitispirillum peregrinum]|uniref:DUF4132 domain-containing protein n=1 Tax=Insolitispirillum peregrinum TaxID=80876 RepID=UPI003621D2A7
MSSSDLANSRDGVLPPWLTAGPVVLTSSERAGLSLPTRKNPHALSSRPSLSALWSRVCERAAKAGNRVDMVATECDLRPALQRMQDRQRQDHGVPAADTGADALLLAISFGNYPAHLEDFDPYVAQWILQRYSLAGAINIYLLAQKVQVHIRYDQGPGYIYHLTSTVTEPLAPRWPRGCEELLLASLAAAPQDVWQDCVERIRAALPSLPPCRQPLAALLLPDVPELSNALIAQFVSQKAIPATAHWLALTATGTHAIASALKVSPPGKNHVWDDRRMVATLITERGESAVACLERGAADPLAGDALLDIGTPEAVAALGRVASTSKTALARLATAVDRWPVAALVALSALVANGGKDADPLIPRLNRLLREQADRIEAVRPWLDAKAQGVIDRQLALLAPPVNPAAPGDLPVVLTTPPWLASKRKKAARSAMAVEVLPVPPLEMWDPVDAKEAGIHGRWLKSSALKNPENLHHLVERISTNNGRVLHQVDGKNVFVHRFHQEHERYTTLVTAAIHSNDKDLFIKSWLEEKDFMVKKEGVLYFDAAPILLLPAAFHLPLWEAVTNTPFRGLGGVDYLMMSLGIPALPGFLKVLGGRSNEWFRVIRSFGATELAPLAARAFARLKTVSADGRAWLLKFPEHAICGLIPPALGAVGEARDCAVSALRMLREHGHQALLDHCVARYDSPAIREALFACLDETPLDRFPARQGKLPNWWQPDGWRRPQLPNGTVLSNQAIEHLGQMMSFPISGEVYAGIGEVRAVCTADSLAHFAWDVFISWLEAAAPSRDSWAMTALGLLGNDECARKLAAFIRAWPGEGLHTRAVSGLDALAMIGSDVALLHLYGIAQKSKFKALQEQAQAKIQSIADARTLTVEDLEDRLVPDLELDEQGGAILDFGARAFRVGFDEALRPVVWELAADGCLVGPLADLPKARKTDDPALVRVASDRFKALKKDVRAIARQQVLRLETAMCTRRRWTPDEFRMFLADHPLMRHLVRRLLWGVYETADSVRCGGRLLTCFRVEGDGRLATANGELFQMPDGEPHLIGIPHVLDLSVSEAAAFGQYCADAGLLQPFLQIDREIHTLTAGEKRSGTLDRWRGISLPTLKLLGLCTQGWQRGPAEDHGYIYSLLKPLAGGKVAELTLKEGFGPGLLEDAPEQELLTLRVGPLTGWGGVETPDLLGVLDDVTLSELIADVEGLFR